MPENTPYAPWFAELMREDHKPPCCHECFDHPCPAKKFSRLAVPTSMIQREVDGGMNAVVYVVIGCVAVILWASASTFLILSWSLPARADLLELLEQDNGADRCHKREEYIL